MMRSKKGRGAKTPTGPQDESQKDPSLDSLESHNLSTIERASFLEAAQQNYGNPLHSTAVEEDLNLPEEGAVARRGGGRRGGVTKGALQTGRAAATKQHGAASQRKGKEEEEKSRRNTEGKVKARPRKEGGKKRKTGAIEEERRESDVQGEESDPGPAPRKTNQASSDGETANGIRRLVGKRAAKRTVGPTSAARPVKNGGMKREKKRKRDAGSKKSNSLQSQEESDSAPTQQSRQPIPSTDEVTDEDTSWTPSQKRARVYSLDRARKSSSDRSQARKSSSGSDSAKPEETSRDQQKERRRGRRGGTELDVVLDAFLDFCDQYRESVESTAVRQAIDSLCTSVKEQLTEKIATSTELRVLRRDNIKVDSLIRKKRQRLLDAKYELIKAEQQLRSLQKQEARLALRLADLRRGHAFLRDIKELNRQYLDHRRKQPKEKEEYGASSLPALLLETKYVLGTEHQLKRINNRLADRLQETRK